MGIFDNLSGIDAPCLTGFAPTDMEQAELELSAPTMPHLADDRAYDTEGTERAYADARQADNATAAVERIPGPTEARHLIIAGRFALFDCIAAVLALGAPATIAEVYIATLGFSKRNVVQLAAMLDAGTVGAVTLLCSHYFAGTSKPIWEVADRELGARGQRFLSLRTHAKILAMKLTDGRTVTIESSANLRSCKNIEQLTLYGSPALFDFHSTWIKGLAPNGT